MIILDSNIWIFAESVDSEEHEAANKKVKDILSLDKFGINVIIVSEVYHILSRIFGREVAASRIRNILEHPSAEWLELQEQIIIGAINLSRNAQININDAIIAEQSLRLGAALLTDNLKDFKKVRNLRLVPLR